ncbi:hypothetical protein HDU67_003471 [Dinochytrium kinnereticum]|nr:hypothetical protein HDU67_003471 [Dinochytrium kinnereticum]
MADAHHLWVCCETSKVRIYGTTTTVTAEASPLGTPHFRWICWEPFHPFEHLGCSFRLPEPVKVCGTSPWLVRTEGYGRVALFDPRPSSVRFRCLQPASQSHRQNGSSNFVSGRGLTDPEPLFRYTWNGQWDPEGRDRGGRDLVVVRGMSMVVVGAWENAPVWMVNLPSLSDSINTALTETRGDEAFTKVWVNRWIQRQENADGPKWVASSVSMSDTAVAILYRPARTADSSAVEAAIVKVLSTSSGKCLFVIRLPSSDVCTMGIGATFSADTTLSFITIDVTTTHLLITTRYQSPATLSKSRFTIYSLFTGKPETAITIPSDCSIPSHPTSSICQDGQSMLLGNSTSAICLKPLTSSSDALLKLSKAMSERQPQPQNVTDVHDAGFWMVVSNQKTSTISKPAMTAQVLPSKDWDADDGPGASHFLTVLLFTGFLIISFCNPWALLTGFIVALELLSVVFAICLGSKEDHNLPHVEDDTERLIQAGEGKVEEDVKTKVVWIGIPVGSFMELI